jgi:ParB/RepB/Spo0J family partition protein
MSTTQLKTPEIELDRIHVVDGFNARRRFDQAELERMAETIRKHGILQPLRVRPREDGDVDLVAGERRWRAAHIAKVKKAPITLGTGSAHVDAFIENVHRAELDPIEQGEGLEAVAGDRGLTTNKAIAAEVGKSPQWVGTMRRLLKLPPKAREAIASGTVPIDAEPALRKIAAASPRVAECVCELFARGDTETGDFVRDLDELIYAVADAAAEGTIEDPPTMIDPRGLRFGEVIEDREEREALAARLHAAAGYVAGSSTDPTITLGEAELTVAEAAGALLAYRSSSGEFSYAVTYLTDKVLAADLVKVAVERREKEAQKREKEARKREKETGKARQEGRADEVDAASGDADRAAAEAERAAELKEIAERRKAAGSYNERVGVALMKRRGSQSRKKFGLARAKAGAIALVRNDRTLAAAGLRLVMPQLQGLQTEAGGEDSAGTVSYASINDAAEFLVGRILDARSAGEVDELIADAQIAAILADDDALEPGEGAWREDPAAEEVAELLGEEIKSLAPRRSPKQRKVEKPSEEA